MSDVNTKARHREVLFSKPCHLQKLRSYISKYCLLNKNSKTKGHMTDFVGKNCVPPIRPVLIQLDKFVTTESKVKVTRNAFDTKNSNISKLRYSNLKCQKLGFLGVFSENGFLKITNFFMIVEGNRAHHLIVVLYMGKKSSCDQLGN